MDAHLQFDKNVFGKDAVLATAYWCADRFVAKIEDKGVRFEVQLEPRAGVTMTDKDIEEFQLMLVHNQMRSQLAAKFADLETAIVQKAFAPVRNRQG